MKFLRIVAFLIIASAAFAQSPCQNTTYMTCWSFIYVAPLTGLANGGGETIFQDPYGYSMDDSVDAFVQMSVTDQGAGTQVANDWEEDNLGLGDARAVFSDVQVQLADTYTVNSSHEVDGDIMVPCEDPEYCSFDSYGVLQYIHETKTSSDQASIPAGPTDIFCNGVDTSAGTGTAWISYTVSPPDELVATSLSVGGQITWSDNGTNPSFPIDQLALPPGPSTILFQGIMYGWYFQQDPSRWPVVIRTDSSPTKDHVTCCAVTGGDQFAFDVSSTDFMMIEGVTHFDYSVAPSGVGIPRPTYFKGGIGNFCCTDVGGVTFSDFSVYHSLYDNASQWTYGEWLVEPPGLVATIPGTISLTDTPLMPFPAWIGDFATAEMQASIIGCVSDGCLSVSWFPAYLDLP